MQGLDPVGQDLLAHLRSEVNPVSFDSFFVVLDRLQSSCNLRGDLADITINTGILAFSMHPRIRN